MIGRNLSSAGTATVQTGDETGKQSLRLEADDLDTRIG